MNSALLRRFTDVVEFFDRGRFAVECNTRLQEAIEFLEALPAEKGTATMTVEVKIKFDGGRLDLVPKLTSKLPEKTFPATVFWAHDGALSVQHPSQVDMFAGPEDAEERQRRRENAGG